LSYLPVNEKWIVIVELAIEECRKLRDRSMD